jgi:hypothetical protein
MKYPTNRQNKSCFFFFFFCVRVCSRVLLSFLVLLCNRAFSFLLFFLYYSNATIYIYNFSHLVLRILRHAVRKSFASKSPYMCVKKTNKQMKTFSSSHLNNNNNNNIIQTCYRLRILLFYILNFRM